MHRYVLKRYSVDTERLKDCMEKYACNVLEYDIALEKRVKMVTEACLKRAV